MKKIENFNIKWFRPLISVNLSNWGAYNGDYFIVFNDESELDIINNRYSLQDCLKGKDANNFKKSINSKQASELLDKLVKEIGFTKTNQGKVVVVNTKNIKTQIIL